MGDDTTLTLYVHHETDKAYLVSEDGERDGAEWLAKSQIKYERDLDEADGLRMIEVTLPEWLARKKGYL